MIKRVYSRSAGKARENGSSSLSVSGSISSRRIPLFFDNDRPRPRAAKLKGQEILINGSDTTDSFLGSLSL